MTLIQNLSTALKSDLKTFTALQVIIAAVCITMPFLLYIGDSSETDFRGSISDYVNMKKSYIFGMLLCVAAMLFIYNGAVYFRRQEKGQLRGMQKHGQWYNLILGLCLFGVILFPHDKQPVLHYTFAITFFAGCALVIALFHKEEDRAISIVIAILSVISYLLVPMKVLTVFWAEWVSLTVIGIHSILESKGVISFTEPNH